MGKIIRQKRKNILLKGKTIGVIICIVCQQFSPMS